MLNQLFTKSRKERQEKIDECFKTKKKYKEDYLESDRELQAKEEYYLQLDRDHLQHILEHLTLMLMLK